MRPRQCPPDLPHRQRRPPANSRPQIPPVIDACPPSRSNAFTQVAGVAGWRGSSTCLRSEGRCSGSQAPPPAAPRRSPPPSHRSGAAPPCGVVTGGERPVSGPVLPMVATKRRGRRRPFTLAARELADDHPRLVLLARLLSAQLRASGTGKFARRWRSSTGFLPPRPECALCHKFRQVSGGTVRARHTRSVDGVAVPAPADLTWLAEAAGVVAGEEQQVACSVPREQVVASCTVPVARGDQGGHRLPPG